MNLSKTKVKKLQSVLNAGIRSIYDIYDRSADVISFYKKAHILPVEKRIFFKVCDHLFQSDPWIGADVSPRVGSNEQK